MQMYHAGSTVGVLVRFTIILTCVGVFQRCRGFPCPVFLMRNGSACQRSLGERVMQLSKLSQNGSLEGSRSSSFHGTQEVDGVCNIPPTAH
ncbi:hypothetical protein EV401DRAFT_1969827 [Pisolithus croceorrhizus]|nr:hypothetical protein EV401DRAFT_1969827 [Pisolithus croceorrhizus]